MLRKEFIELISEETGETKVNIDKMISAIFKTIEDVVSKGDSVQVAEFGVFKQKIIKARRGVNPFTKEKINIPEKKSVTFKVSAKLKAKLNQ